MDPRLLLSGSLDPAFSDGTAGVIFTKAWTIWSNIRYSTLLLAAMFLVPNQHLHGQVALPQRLATLSTAEATPRRHWTSYAYPACFEHISVEQGLSQSFVHWMVQDRLGFLWFATDAGLNRYDGNRFLVLHPDEQNKEGSLGHDRVSWVMEDHRGLLWACTNDGLTCIDPRTLEIHTYRASKEPGSLSSNEMKITAEDREGNLWIGTSDTGLCMLSKEWKPFETPQFQRFESKGKEIKGPPSGRIDHLLADRQNRMWFASADLGIGRILPGPTPTFEYFPYDLSKPDSSAPRGANSILEDPLGTLWFGSYEGLFNCDPDKVSFLRILSSPKDPTTMGNNMVRALNLDRSGILWVSNEGGGLSKMLPRRSKDEAPRFQRFQHDVKDPSSLSSNGVQFAIEDRSGVLWVSSAQAGLNKLVMNLNRGSDREKAKLFQYRSNAADTASLTGNLIGAIGEDRFGNLWVGTDGTGLNRVIPPTQPTERLRFERFRAEPGRSGALQGDAIIAVYLDADKQLWLGTYMAGLIRIDQSSATGAPRFIQFKSNPSDPNTLSSDYLRCILDDGHGRLWIGTGNAGLNLFDPKTQKVKRYFLGRDGKAAMRINPEIFALAMDSFGTLWMATPDGLNRLNPQTGECRGYVHEGPGTISNSNVQTVHVDRQGNLWLGTAGGGLNKAVIPPWNGPEPRFQVFDQKDGLPSRILKSIIEDQKGQLWIATDRYLCRFDPKSGKAYPFIYQNELNRAEFVKNSCYLSSSGEVFIGSNDGLSLFHPDDIVGNTVVPKVAITDFQVLNKSVPLQDRMPGGAANSGEQEITLTPKDSAFSFDFAALHFVAPERNQYAYTMEGLDTAWNQMGNKHAISYTTLPPGDYVLGVKASNCDGVWGDEGLRLKIHILPPWYKTWWFRTLLAGLLLCSIYVIVRIRLRVLNHRNQLLKKVVAARTSELAEANKELAEANEALRNQSLTDPLTGLRNRRFLHACMPEDVAQVQRVQRDVATNNFERMALNIDILFIMVDIDHFKSVNDQHGHHAGDMVLRQMSAILQGAMRGSDTVTRWGGEEFLLVARNAARTDASIPPERIRAAMEAHAFDIGEDQPIHCTCSIGFSVFPLLPNETGLFTWEQIVNVADTCLYAAKRSGRNAWVGIVPDTSDIDEASKVALTGNAEGLIHSGLFKPLTSLQKPIQWDSKDE